MVTGDSSCHLRCCITLIATTPAERPDIATGRNLRLVPVSHHQIVGT